MNKILARIYGQNINIINISLKNVPILRCSTESASTEKADGTDLLKSMLQSRELKCPEDWKLLRNEAVNYAKFTPRRKRFEEANIDAAVIGTCISLEKYDLGYSYLHFLQNENIKPNLATLGKFLRLLYRKNCDSCSEKDENQIYTIYEEVRKEYKILSPTILENLLLALSITRHWQKSIDLLREIQAYEVPGNSAYSATIAAAFRNYEQGIAWQLLNEMIGNSRTPQSSVFITYMETVGKLKDKIKKFEHLEKLLYFCQRYQIKFAHDVIESITKVTRRMGIEHAYTKADYSTGKCGSCNKTLKQFEVTDNEFSMLKSRVMKQVIVGKDVFARTNPVELRKFQNFISNMESFDVVVDGLNVAYSVGNKHSPFLYSALLAAVVSHFVQQGKSVLVIGRQHMDRWPKSNWNYVTRNSTVFLLQNLSQDDPYLLFCALQSGKNTIIVTRDLMRSHKFLLKDPKLELVFEKWLSQRQWQLIRFDKNNVPLFQPPRPFTTTPQKIDSFWHIPFHPPDDPTFNIYWLCLKS